MIFFSSLFSTITIFAILLFSGKINILSFRQNGFERYLKEISPSLLFGFLNPFLYYLVLFKAYSLLPAQIAQPLNYSWVIVVSLLSVIILKQKISYISFIGLFISFTGIILISTRGDFNFLNMAEPVGVLLAVGSSLIWGSYWILNLRDRRNDLVKLFWNFAAGTLFSFISMIIFGNSSISFEGIISTAYIGFFEMGFTFFIWMKALAYSENTAKVGNIIYLSPFISFIFINFILKEAIGITSIIGLILIILGVLTQQFRKN